jgi:peptidylprolyl isomerase
LRDILISSAVCLACLVVAFVSQLVAPSTVEAAAQAMASTPPPAAMAAVVTKGTVVARLELDPDESNPVLFTMAPETPTNPNGQLASANSQGG